MTHLAHVYITGRVQGVGFRYATQRQAQNLGLTGWVRNLHDGRVEAAFEGDRETVQTMVGWCHTGPTFAKVEKVEVDWDEAQEQYDTFALRF